MRTRKVKKRWAEGVDGMTRRRNGKEGDGRRRKIITMRKIRLRMIKRMN